MSSGDANNVLFAGNPAYAGRGSHVIAFRMTEGVLQPGVQPNEMGSHRFLQILAGRRDLPRTQPIWLVRSMLIIENYDDLLTC